MDFQRWQSGKLTFEKIKADDLPFLISFMARPEVSAHKPDPSPNTAKEITSSLHADIEHWQREGIGRWTVHHKGQVIGTCGLMAKQGRLGLNVAYYIVPEFWGQGLASDMVGAMMTLAPELQDRFSRLYGIVRAANPASIRVLEKAGFRFAETIDLHGSPAQLFAFDIRTSC